MKLINFLLHSLICVTATAVECDDLGEPEGCELPATDTEITETATSDETETPTSDETETPTIEGDIDTVEFYPVLTTPENDPTFTTKYDVCDDYDVDVCYCKIQSEGPLRHPKPWRPKMFELAGYKEFCNKDEKDQNIPTCCNNFQQATTRQNWMDTFPLHCMKDTENRRYTYFFKSFNCIPC